MIRLIPKFLTRINKYLETRYPLAGRTRIHYFLLYGLIGNLLAILLPTIYLTIIGDFTLEYAQSILLIGVLVSCLILLIWGIGRKRDKIRTKSFKDILTKVSLYALCILLVSSVHITGFTTFVYQEAIKKAPGVAEEYRKLNSKSEIRPYIALDKKAYSHMVIAKEDTDKAIEMLDFFKTNYEIDTKNDFSYISVDDFDLLNSKIENFSFAQTVVYSKHPISVNLFSLLIIWTLITMLLGPAILLIWIDVDFPMNIIGIFLFVLTASLVFDQYSSTRSMLDEIPIWIPIVLFTLLVFFLLNLKRRTSISFIAWCTIPIAALLPMIIFISNLPLISGGYVPITSLIFCSLLFSIIGILLISVMYYVIINKLFTPQQTSE